jgi:circadian clock protein KaiB
MNRHKSQRVIIEVANKPDKDDKPKYALTLYVTGNTPQSARAILNLKRLCNQYLLGHYNLKIVDIYQQPHLATEAQIIAAPTLVKKLPAPIRRFIGDMSNEERLLIGLDLPLPEGG